MTPQGLVKVMNRYLSTMSEPIRAQQGIIDKYIGDAILESRFGSELIAYAWYRSEPLPGFSGQTAMQLVRAGRAADVLEYIDAVDAGVFA